MKQLLKLARLRADLGAALRSAPWAIDADYLLALTNTVMTAKAVEDLQALTAAAPVQAVATGDSIAVINLTGVITPKPSLFTMFFGGTALTNFTADLAAAVNNPKVAGIVINVDSPGGMTDLVPETAAQIRAARDIKPVVAVANTVAASAAYWLAAQASEVVVASSGLVGSIGVFTAHANTRHDAYLVTDFLSNIERKAIGVD